MARDSVTVREPTSPQLAPQPILEVGTKAGLQPTELIPYGRFRAKVDLRVLDRLKDRPDGKLVVVTGITPTRAGEGKTASAISLTEGLGRASRKVALCLREPSMGPLFGLKGGGAGGGRAQIVPADEINMHFNGDIHAVGAAHNLLAAALDASIFHGNPLHIDPLRVTWPRTLDVDDRSLRHIVTGLGGPAHGIPREAHFEITAASEIMAILALASDLQDLRGRLGRIVVADRQGGGQITAEDLRVAGAMAVLLKEALNPNLVQTGEGQPTLVHAGPFGNIAHGNNSLLADRVGLKLADIVVTEAGFGSDLGFEKFCHIVCRYGRMRPALAVLVATVRALKTHGGSSEAQAAAGEDLDALRRGADNLAAHIDNIHHFGVPCVVAVNRFPTDTDRELGLLDELARSLGADDVVQHEGYVKGGAGAEAFAAAVDRALRRAGDGFRPLYPPGTPVREQIEILAREVYSAEGVDFLPEAEKRIDALESQGLGTLPVCMAKTHLSVSHDPARKGRPRGFLLPVRTVYPSVGAGFVVALCGDIQLMPGLGKTPAFTRIDLDPSGAIVGLT
ncbi:MAG TPA: formate--tetrahydrofolate ligase [Candidatus Limnocylindrales bacterium]|nr:formate--tetrahydrofolate ligase [Candidatus Limnocylindrales bacterium]